MWQGLTAALFQTRRRMGFAAAGALALALAACADTLPDLQANAPAGQAQTGPEIAASASLNAAGATVAFIQVSGAPEPVAIRFAAAMSRALGARNIATDEPGKATYLIRGHLTARAAGEGATIAYVWDIYGADRQRRRRLADEISMKGRSNDPWSLADDKALASIAGRSADEIAGFLADAPHAVSAFADGGGNGAGAQASATPLAYAPVR